MPKFWKRDKESVGDQSPWFVRIRDRTSSAVNTFQLKPPAIRILHGMGLQSGDSFERQQFWTLYNLDLTYTLSDSAVPDLDQEISDQTPEDIPPEQRVAFVREILRDYSVSDIDSDEFYRLLLSIELRPDDARNNLVEFLVSETPVDPDQLETLSADSNSVFSSAVFGALVCHDFNQFLEGATRIGTGYCEPIAHRDDHVYLVHEGVAWDLNPGLCDFYLDFPEFYLDEVVSIQPAMCEHKVLEEIYTSQLFDDAKATSDTIGRILHNGFSDIESVIIVPKNALAGTEIKHTFTFRE